MGDVLFRDDDPGGDVAAFDESVGEAFNNELDALLADALVMIRFQEILDPGEVVKSLTFQLDCEYFKGGGFDWQGGVFCGCGLVLQEDVLACFALLSFFGLLSGSSVKFFGFGKGGLGQDEPD